MKKIYFLKILTMVLIFSITVVGCDNGIDGNGDEFTITFYLQGGKVNGNTSSVGIKVNSGETITTLPTQTREGYLSGTTWESTDHPNTWTVPEPANGGLRFFFSNSTNWKQTGIVASTTEFANGTYVIIDNTVTITTVYYWNGTAAVPQVITYTATIQNNTMSIDFGAQHMYS